MTMLLQIMVSILRNRKRLKKVSFSLNVSNQDSRSQIFRLNFRELDCKEYCLFVLFSLNDCLNITSLQTFQIVVTV